MVLGSSVTVTNTFEDATITSGVQAVFGLSDPITVVDPGVELSNFIGFYDIDISDDGLTMTLVDNSGATDLVIPDDRFDRYYFEFDTSTIASASLDGLSELNEFATVQVLDPGFVLDASDIFGTGISTPIEFETGGLLVELGPGTDLTNIGVSATIDFEEDSSEESILGDSATVLNTLQDTVITGGVEATFGEIGGPEIITNDVEFPNFIGFYDIDISDTSLTMTLVDNSQADSLLFPADRFDRYYFEFDTSTIASASLDGLSELNEFATVQVLDPGFVLDAATDILPSDISTPIEFENGGLLVQFGPGTDLTNLGVSATIDFVRASSVAINETGTPESERLSGAEGDDTIVGLAGNDTIDGSGGDDQIIGSRGSDSLYGKDGNDTIEGRQDNDRLFGGNGDDLLLGGQGRDRLNSGAGNDTLIGGASIDRFIFSTNDEFDLEELGVDEISDFVPGQDIILLGKSTFTAIASDSGEGFSLDGEFTTVTSDADAETSAGIIVYNSSNGKLFYNANGTEAEFGSGGEFANLANLASISENDFFLRV
ncbi:MAG: calcium-binding protein [Okeania sp. SIO2C9]|uniref:calcium-binding protein n=1 Tax=Okeania sp. SIO2C9 TaxID=2607791 RepID=UPI0013C18268|nr:calcium-binding protein [Okeania sp. SIO2C9]NEQ72237.1 calcium-binding protein [Okeania sp. SIO2C9]